MIERWNEVVKPDDLVYNLGDLFCCSLKHKVDYAIEIIQQLNGEIILVPGNHDYDYSLNIYRSEGIQVIDDIYLIVNDVLMSHYPRRVINTPRYKDSYRIVSIKEKLKKVYKKHGCKYHFYGHSHNYPARKKNELNVCCNLHDYYPLKMEKLLD